MYGKFGPGTAAAGAAESIDGRSTALDLMSRALAHLDSDGTIPLSIGAQLQLAIDALWPSGSPAGSSSQLH